MQLVVLAAGHGRRFGGLKQLAPVGPSGEALMDYTAADAAAAGFDGVVLIVRPEVERELMAHVERHWPASLDVTPLRQGPIAGTAQAVASARRGVDGSFGVANADDYYGTASMALLATKLEGLSPSRHTNIGYRLADTVVTDAPVTRGLCELSEQGDLVGISEQVVQRAGAGFRTRPLAAEPGEEVELSGDEPVSMNLWGFHPSVLDDLDAAVAGFEPETAPHQPGKPPELLLPGVVGDLVSRGAATVHVARTNEACVGITHPDDLELVRSIFRERERAS